MNMHFREARPNDIAQIQFVRNCVRENQLSDPRLVTDKDCLEYITKRGKGWVCIVDKKIVGFAIADLLENNIWALFVLPEYEKQGIGKQLQKMMLDWYFGQGKSFVWLSTAPNTRAELFYRKSGWHENGTYGKGEIKFEMNDADWRNNELNGLQINSN